VRVLVIEDAPAVRTRLVAMFVVIPGVDDVVAVGGLNDGLEALRAQPHGVVILDLHLPDGSGADFLTQAKPAFPDVLVYVVTNDATEHHRRQMMALGADAFFDKSRDFDALVERVGHAALKLAAAGWGGSSTWGVR
jgi:DNA-binding NarL/FixJ family response regulator